MVMAVSVLLLLLLSLLRLLRQRCARWGAGTLVGSWGPRKGTELGGIHGFLRDKALGPHRKSSLGSLVKQDAGGEISWGFS